MGSDWKRELAGLRNDLPPDHEGSFKSAEPLKEDALGKEEVLSPDLEFPTQSVFYITYAYNFDLDPEIRKQYPEGKQQYLNAILRSIEAGQNPWPGTIANKQEALGVVSESDIRQWFESSGKQAIEAAGYSDPEKYLQEILNNNTLYNPSIQNPALKPAVEQSSGLITDPDQGESQANFFNTRSIMRDEALRSRLVKKRVPESAQKVRPQHISREGQGDFAGSKGMKKQEEAGATSGIIVNTGTGPREESPQERQARGPKFNKKLGVFVHPDYSPKNYKGPTEGKLEVAAGTETWLRQGEGKDSGLKISGEVAERVGNVKFDWNGIERGGDTVYVDFVGKVENKNNGRLEDRNVSLAFNLSKECLAAAKAGERLAIEESAKACIVKNQGVPFVQIAYDSSSGNILFGLGQKNLPEIGVPLSPDGLRKVAGKRVDEVLEYLDRRSREFSSLNYEKEKEPMWAFDTFLLEQYVPERNKKLKQLVWDEALRQVWEQAVGPEKLQKFSEQAEQAPRPQPVIINSHQPRSSEQRAVPAIVSQAARNPEKNRWLVSPDIGQKGDIMQPKNKFFSLIQEQFGTDYRKFLEAGKFREFANEAELSAPEAINLAAEKILLEAGRNADYEEFQKFAELPRDNQAQFLVQNGLRVGSEHTFGLLFKRLYLFVSAGEAKQSDNSNIGEGTVKARSRTRTTETTQVARTEAVSVERQPVIKNDHSDVTAKILARAKKRAANRPYNPNNDPEVEAGII